MTIFFDEVDYDDPVPTRVAIYPLHDAIRSNDLGAVKALVESKEHDINCLDSNGSTPIYIAAELNHGNIFRYLLANGANPNIPNKNNITANAIAYALWHDKVIEKAEHTEENPKENNGIDVSLQDNMSTNQEEICVDILEPEQTEEKPKVNSGADVSEQEDYTSGSCVEIIEEEAKKKAAKEAQEIANKPKKSSAKYLKSAIAGALIGFCVGATIASFLLLPLITAIAVVGIAVTLLTCAITFGGIGDIASDLITHSQDKTAPVTRTTASDPLVNCSGNSPAPIINSSLATTAEDAQSASPSAGSSPRLTNYNKK